MFGLRMKAWMIGLAALTLGGTLAASTSPAEAQRYYRRAAYPAGYYGVPIRRPAIRPAYRRIVARGYRPHYRRAAYRYPRYGYRPARYYGYFGPRQRYGYRPARYYGNFAPRYRPARYYGYFGPRYGYPYGYGYRPATYFGYGGPRYRYGYYGYPYYRSSFDGGALAAGLIGGLALGAIAASAPRAVYYQRPAYSNCWLERRRIVNRYGRASIRRVRVCA